MNDQTKTPQKMPAALPADAPFGWLRNELDRMVDEFGRPGRSLFNFGAQLAPLPALEMREKDGNYLLSAELPGLEEKDVELTVADGTLTISGEKRDEQERKDHGFMLSERRYGSFSRSVRLPSDVDQDKISAAFSNGVLTVTMARNGEAARGRKIEIAKA